MMHEFTSEERETLETYDKMSELWSGAKYDRPRDQIRGKFYSLAPRGGRFLDLGCGTGKDTPLIVAEGLKYVGIDLSQGMLKIAMRDRKELMLASWASFLKMSAYELSFANRSFDAVMAFALFQHIPRQNTGEVLAEIKRVLKSGGRALVTIVLGEGEIMLKSRRHNCGSILITKWHTRDFVEATEQTGLSVSSCEEFINASSSDELGRIAILNLLRKEQ